MSISKIRFGAYTLWPIQTGHFRLDGGAMFGVVPKTLWSRQMPSDDSNRIPMCSRSLLIHSEHTDRLYLIDTGVGHKFDPKFEQIYDIDFSRGSLKQQLSEAGFEPGDIDDVIFTHLHFDHCGGASEWNKDRTASELLFPDANLWITRSHWNTASHPNAREKASFLTENLRPIGQHKRLILTDGAHVFEDDFYTMIVNGHTTGQQLPVLEDGDRKLVFIADLLPTRVHTPLQWLMGYDMAPLVTLEERQRLFSKACDENWFLFLEHDPVCEIMQMHSDAGKFSIRKTMQLADL